LDLAQQKSNLASANEALAGEKSELATRALELAEQEKTARGEEARQRQRAEWELYRRLLDDALRMGRRGKANQAGLMTGIGQVMHPLDACRWDLRGWEYYHLRHQADGARLAFNHLAPFVHALAFSADGKRLAAGAGAEV